MRIGLLRFFKTAGYILLILVGLIGIAAVTGGLPVRWQGSTAAAMGWVRLPWQAAAEENGPAPSRTVVLGVELVKGQPNTLFVPAEVREALGIRKNNVDLIAVAKKPTHSRPLVMAGSTALDPTRLFRVRARFAPSPSSAEVTEIAQVTEDPAQTGKLESVFREIRSGDRVQKGDLLVVFHSVDVGNKKNDLIDAIYQLKLDQEILKAAEAKAEVVPEVFLWNARRNVQRFVILIPLSETQLLDLAVSQLPELR
jgi:cobalt-zinc-cadmium efflux system membrane fusion protein